MSPVLTAYDEQHAVTYVRLLDAEANDADWREVARIVLHTDPNLEPGRARRPFDGHTRAKWMTSEGYRRSTSTGYRGTKVLGADLELQTAVLQTTAQRRQRRAL
jgi:hypothetical protein